MISGGKPTATATLVLEKTEDTQLSPRILELRRKIQSQDYLDNAIQRIRKKAIKNLYLNSVF